MLYIKLICIYFQTNNGPGTTRHWQIEVTDARHTSASGSVWVCSTNLHLPYQKISLYLHQLECLIWSEPSRFRQPHHNGAVGTHLTCYQLDLSLNPIKGSCCFLKQENLTSLLRSCVMFSSKNVFEHDLHKQNIELN